MTSRRARAVARNVALLVGYDETVKRRARLQLEHFGNDSISAVIDAAEHADNEEGRPSAVNLLGYLGGPEARDALLRLLRNPIVDVATEAGWALGELGDPIAIPAL